MKMNIEIECTPEEARRAIGLPDLTPLHERYLATLMEGMDGVSRPELVETVMKSWAPVNDAGLAFWRRLFESGGKSGG